MSEKRNLGRKRKRLKVRFGVETAKRMAFTDDISKDGMFIKTAMPENPGTLIKVELTTPDQVTIKCQGRVHWAKKVPPNMLHMVGKGGMGVKLTTFEEGEEIYFKLVDELRR